MYINNNIKYFDMIWGNYNTPYPLTLWKTHPIEPSWLWIFPLESWISVNGACNNKKIRWKICRWITIIQLGENKSLKQHLMLLNMSEVILQMDPVKAFQPFENLKNSNFNENCRKPCSNKKSLLFVMQLSNQPITWELLQCI